MQLCRKVTGKTGLGGRGLSKIHAAQDTTMPKRELSLPPPAWGADALTAFIDNARLNTFATFADRSPNFVRLKDKVERY